MIKEKFGNTDNLVKKYGIDGPIEDIQEKLKNFDPFEEPKSKTDLLDGVDTKVFYGQLNQNFEKIQDFYKTTVKLVKEIKQLHSRLHVKIYNLANALSKISSFQKNIEKANETVMPRQTDSVSFSESYDILKMSLYTWSNNEKEKSRNVDNIFLPHFEKLKSSAVDMRNVKNLIFLIF